MRTRRVAPNHSSTGEPRTESIKGISYDRLLEPARQLDVIGAEADHQRSLGKAEAVGHDAVAADLHLVLLIGLADLRLGRVAAAAARALRVARRRVGEPELESLARVNDLGLALAARRAPRAGCRRLGTRGRGGGGGAAHEPERRRGQYAPHPPLVPHRSRAGNVPRPRATL